MDDDDSQSSCMRDTCDHIMDCIMADTSVTTCDCYLDVPLLKPRDIKPPIYWSQLKLELSLSDTSYEDSQWPDFENSGVFSPPLSINPPPLSIPIHDSPPQQNSGNGLKVHDLLYNLVVPDSPESRVNSSSSWARPHLNPSSYGKRKGRKHSSFLVNKKPKKLTIKEKLQMLKDCISSQVI